MTLLDAQTYDFAKARRRKIKIAITIAVIIVLAVLGWMYRNWPEEHIADKFFAALQHQEYETAYGIYFNDPDWQKHQQKCDQRRHHPCSAIGARTTSGRLIVRWTRWGTGRRSG